MLLVKDVVITKKKVEDGELAHRLTLKFNFILIQILKDHVIMANIKPSFA